MQKILLIIAFTFNCFFNVSAQKQKLYDLFDKYQETEGVTSIKIAKPMFSMLNKLDIKDAELENIKPMLSKIQGLRILVIEKPENKESKDVDYNKLISSFNSLQAEISKSLKTLNYDELMTVNSKGNKIKFLSSDAQNGNLENLLLSINSEGNTVLMMLDGLISMDDVNNLINETQNSAENNFQSSSSASKSVTTEVRNVEKFDGIKVSSGITVNFTQSNNQRITVDTDPGLHQYIKTEVVDGILVINIDAAGNKKLKFKKLQVNVSAPQLNKIAVNSAANFKANNTLNADYFQIAATSAGKLEADIVTKGKVDLSATSGSKLNLNVVAQKLEMSATSASDVILKGNADETNFQVSSAATVNARDMKSKYSQISASSAANLNVNVSHKIDAVISSGANVKYVPNTKLDRNAKLTGGGSLKPL